MCVWFSPENSLHKEPHDLPSSHEFISIYEQKDVFFPSWCQPVSSPWDWRVKLGWF